MVTIEQVKQLELRVSKAIEYLSKLTEENTLLKGKLDSYQKRIDELEILIQRFKEEQGRIEEGIVSALDRLNRFEDAVEKTMPTERPAEVAAKAPPERPVPVVVDDSGADDASLEPEILEEVEEVEEGGGGTRPSELDIF